MILRRPYIEENHSSVPDAWQQAKAGALADQLSGRDMRNDWRDRALEISMRLLRELPHSMQEVILRPLARRLGDKLWDCWCDRGRDAGEWEIDRFESNLRLAVQQLTKGEQDEA